MRENTLKQKLQEGKAAFGVMLTFPSAPMVEMLGHLGYDWILIDNEHGSVTVENSEDMIRAAELTGMAPIVRPVSNKPEIIAPFLDRGAWGVQIPHVNTAEEARAAVDAVKYPLQGHRGVFSGGRPGEYGFRREHRRVCGGRQPQHPGLPDDRGGRGHRKPGGDGRRGWGGRFLSSGRETCRRRWVTRGSRPTRKCRR